MPEPSGEEAREVPTPEKSILKNEIPDIKIELPVLEFENPAEVAQEVDRLTKKLKIYVREEKLQPQDPDALEKRIVDYQIKYLPEHLRTKHKNIIKRGIETFSSWFAKDAEGKENIPEGGPFVIICNHFGPETNAILKNFKDYNLHIVVGNQIWGERSSIHRWLFEKMGMVFAKESLAHLTKEEKEASLLKQDAYGKQVFRKIIDREEQGNGPVDTEFIRQSVALLARGDVICIFPEGLWLDPKGFALNPRENPKMKQGYAGFELIARQYKKLTGKDLPILPTAFAENKDSSESGLRVGEPVVLGDNKTEFGDADWCMAQIAKMLPEEQRGYYKDIVEELEKSQ